MYLFSFLYLLRTFYVSDYAEYADMNTTYLELMSNQVEK